MTTVVILQPSYLPWLGFFDQFDRSDVFVFYDDVQFDKNGWRNRNRIKGPMGATWLTVPVRQSGRAGQAIMDVEIDQSRPWAVKHLRSLRQFYARSPFLGRYMDGIEEVLCRPWSRLVDLDIELSLRLCGMIGLDREVHRASALGIGGDRSSRLVNICRHFGATRYLSGMAAISYLQGDLFAEAGIEIQFQDYLHPVYPQQFGEFVSHLAVVDLLFNAGPDALRLIRAGAAALPG
jgi:hypothetical protein